MITKVKLVNWRSHLNTEVNFEKGTNGLMGPIGSGKTSLLDAICFAFFGSFPTLQSRKIKLDDVIMSKPFLKNRAEVLVEFLVDGKRYNVIRRIERGKGTVYAEISENGKVIEAPNSQRVTEMIEKILKVNYELFTRSIYSEQNALDYFLTLPKGQRMKKIDELLGIEKFEKIRANCVSVLNKIADRKSGKEGLLSKVDLDGLKNELKKQINLIKELEGKENELLEKLKIIEKELELKEEEFNQLKKVNEELGEMRKNIGGFEKAIEELEESLKRIGELKIKDLKISEKKISEISSILNQLQSNYKERVEEQERIYKRFVELTKSLEVLKKEKIEKIKEEIEEKLKKKKEIEEIEEKLGRNYEEKLEKKKKFIEKLLSEIEKLKAKVFELKEQIDDLSSVEGKCPVCERRISEELKKRLVKEKGERIKELEDEINKKIKKSEVEKRELKIFEESINLLKDLIKEIKDLDELKLKLKELESELESLEAEKDRKEKELNALSCELEKMENEIKKKENEKNELEREISKLREYETINERLKKFKERKMEFEVKAKKLEEILQIKKFDEYEKKLRELTGEKKEIEAYLSTLENLKKEKIERKEKIEKELKVFENERKEVEKMERIIKQLKIFSEAISKTQIDLRKNFVSTVNYTMNKIWQDLYPYRDFTGIRLEIERGDYVLKLQERSGKWRNVEGIASGGERSLAALTLRVAFALVLTPQLRWLILDEPTANLDRKAIQTFALILKNNIIDFIDQTFIITHQEELADGITGHLYRFERDKSKDEPTRVIKVL